MSGLIAGLAGAPQAASNAGGYYQNAAGEIVNATGSPAAATFTRLLNRSLQPQFAQQDAGMNAMLAAQGITNSGQGRSDFGNLAAQQSGQIAGADAPLYQEALGQYGNIIGAMPGAQTQSYNDALQNFYNALGGGLSGVGSFFGMGGFGGSGGGTSAPAAPQYSGGNYSTDPYYGVG